MALGGRYFNLRQGTPTGWNPFQMEPTKGNVAFMRRLIVHLASLRGETVTTRQRDEIAKAIEQMTKIIDRNNRGLSTLNTLPPKQFSKNGLRPENQRKHR